jgi:hypothetical protein
MTSWQNAVLRHNHGMASPADDKGRSPFAGCTILLILAGVAVFLVSVSIYSLFQQDREIARFTSPVAAKIAEIPLEGKETELNELHARLQMFRDDLVSKPDKKSTLVLGVDDLNFVLATMAPLKDYKSLFHVTAIRDGRIIADHTRPMNGFPGSGSIRHLNAVATLRPVLAEKSLVFQVEALEVPGSQVPREFIAQIPPYRLGLDLQKDPLLGPVLNAMTAMEASGDKLVLRRIPGETTSTHVTNNQVDSSFQRLLKVLVCGFLVIVGIGVFLGLRAKARKEKAGA